LTNGDVIVLELQNLNENGLAVITNDTTNEPISGTQVGGYANQLGLITFNVGSGNVDVVWNYKGGSNILPSARISGNNNVDNSVTNTLIMGNSNDIESSTNGLVVGDSNRVNQLSNNITAIGNNHIVARQSDNVQILGGVSNYTTGSNTNLTILGGTGSYAVNTDYSAIINGYSAGLRDSDVTTLINAQQNEVVLNGNGHTVIGLNLEGAGLDLLNTRNNSNWLGDTYIGEALFSNKKTLTCGDGTSIDLSDTQYLHDHIFLLNWSGISPGTTTITLPNAANDDYENIIYTFVSDGTFVGSNGSLTEVNIQGFSGQTINGQSSITLKNPYRAITLSTSGSDWISLNQPAPQNYCAFYATSSQVLAATNTSQSIQINSGWEDYGLSISGSDKIVIDNPGTYRLTAVAQLANDSNQPEDAIFWLKFNGVDWPYSGTKTTIVAEKSAGNPSSQIVTFTFVGTSQAIGDYVQLYWAGTSTDLSLKAYAANSTGAGEPAAPSISVMLTPIG